VASTQKISNFVYLALPALSLTNSGTSVILSWPASVMGYEVQVTTNLAGGTGRR